MRIQTNIPQNMRNPQAERNQVSTIESAVILQTTLIKKAKSNKSKGHSKGGKKTCTKHEVNILIEYKLKKANECL